MSKYEDNFFDASLSIIKEASADVFGDLKAGSKGEAFKRFVEVGRVDDSGARSIARDKEYGKRPKIAGLLMEQVNYRHFADVKGGNPDVSTTGHPTVRTSGTPTGTVATKPGTTFTPGDDSTQGSLTFGIGTNPNEGGGDSGNWEVGPDKVGFEISLISDVEGKAKSGPTWNPSHMNGENRSTLVISRRKKEKEDNGDDLAHRYFSRVHDVFIPVPTNDVKLKRKRFKGGGGGGGGSEGTSFDPGTDTTQGSLTFGIGTGGGGGAGKAGDSFFIGTGSEEEYHDGIWKSAINITPVENPGITLQQKNENNNGPGKDGWALLDYVKGFPVAPGADDAEKPATSPQGGWLYDANQDTLGNLNDLIGIDAYKVDDCKLPRYHNRHKQKVSIAYIRHDAHFMKQGDVASPPPKGNGSRLSGRIYFTEPFKCPEVGGGTSAVATLGVQAGSVGPTAGSIASGVQGAQEAVKADAEDSGSPVCGEMILDVERADDPSSNIKHESGEWRPMIKAGGGGGGGDKYDYSYHSKPKKYSGSGTMGGGGPTPQGNPTDTTAPSDPGQAREFPSDVPDDEQHNLTSQSQEIEAASQAEAAQSSSNVVPKASAGTMTSQSQVGAPPPESPGNAMNVNIFENIQAPLLLNTAAVFTTTKPVGYRTMKIITWIRASDVIPDGQFIEMNIIAGEYGLDDKGPQEFWRGGMRLTPGLFPNDKKWKRVVMRWSMLDSSTTHPITVWVERRNDLSNVDVEVWILKHNISFEP